MEIRCGGEETRLCDKRTQFRAMHKRRAYAYQEAEFSYRRNMRLSHRVTFALLVQAFALPRLKDV
jgi:hypothetical protein